MESRSMKYLNNVLVVIILLLATSCGSKENTKIPLKEVDQKLKSKGSLIVGDILKSLNHSEGARYLLGKDYVTPMVHGRIVMNEELYEKSYSMGSLILGTVSEYKLVQVIDKGLIKSMRYQLTSDNKDLKFVELKIDINIENTLADFYLYVTDFDGILKRENILPTAIK